MSVNFHLLALQLMAAQGILGAFDTLYHHELTEALASRPTARRELGIHAVRAMIYAVLFIGLSAWAWHGAWAWVLMAIFGIEIVLTLWDFVIEDLMRMLPATERVTHTVLAINGGAFIILLALNLPAWQAQATTLVWQPYGWLSVFLALCGVGVGLSGLRDAWAVRQLGRRQARPALAPIHFADTSQHVLVTGGTGFIGQLLVHALVLDGHQVTVLTRRPRQAAWLLDGAARCITDLHHLPASTRVDVVINLAGARILGWRWTARRQAALLKSRLGPTQAVVDWIAQAVHKPQLLLSASAIGFYGVQARGDAARLGAGGRMGDGQQLFSWIHVQDVLRAVAHIWQASNTAGASADQPRAWNLTAPEAPTQMQFVRTAAQVLRRPACIPMPGWPVRLALGEQADLLLEGQRVCPARLEANGFVFAFPTLRSALQDLG